LDFWWRGLISGDSKRQQGWQIFYYFFQSVDKHEKYLGVPISLASVNHFDAGLFLAKFKERVLTN